MLNQSTLTGNLAGLLKLSFSGNSSQPSFNGKEEWDDLIEQIQKKHNKEPSKGTPSKGT